MHRHESGFSKWRLCTHDVELGNQGNETQIFAFQETIDVLIDVILPRICYLFDTQKLGNWHNAKMK